MTKSIAQRPNSQNLLTQLITNNQLIHDVQSLDASILKRIIHHIGLEDSGELLMLVTSEQLQEVIDQDTWFSPGVGKDERFNATRFCQWLEILLEVGSDFAAEKVSEMDEDLLTLALANLIMAMDSDELAHLTRTAEDDRYSENKYLEKALESTFNMEVEGYLIMSKATFQWDTVSSLLLSLQKDHRNLIERILSRIRFITLEQIDEHDGLYNLLKESQSLEEDVSSEREQRKEQEGYVGPSSAAAFLKLIDQTSLEHLMSQEADPISTMYFRSFKPGRVRPFTPLSPELAKLLRTHGVKTEAPVLKIQSSKKLPSTMRSYLYELRENNTELFKRKILELNFLANVLVSGYSPNQKQHLRPVEAMDLAMRVCDEGFGYVKDLPREDLVKAFKIGWKRRNHR
nr:DUF6178 family protein [uncultured Bdellovibrio sp.]